MLITNSSLVVPHNLIHKYKHVLLNKNFNVFISKKKQHTNTQKKKCLKKMHELKEIEKKHKIREKKPK
jgi:predicted transcriptional regulator